MLQMLDWIKSSRILYSMFQTNGRLSNGFPIISQFLLWKVSLHTQVLTGMDEVVGCGERIFLLKDHLLLLWGIIHFTLNTIGRILDIDEN